MQIYVCGIGTNVGKTHFSGLFCNLFGYDYFKLIQAGLPKDRDFVAKLIPNERILKEGFFLKTAASPHIGKKNENASYKALELEIPKNENLIIELAGGLFTPLDMQYAMIDFMSYFKRPTILVAKNYLGAINHTILSIKTLSLYDIPLLALVCMGKKNDDFTSFIKNYTNITPLYLDFYVHNRIRHDEDFVVQMSDILFSCLY